MATSNFAERATRIDVGDVEKPATPHEESVLLTPCERLWRVVEDRAKSERAKRLAAGLES